jgi:heme/copper-type cytochrome/quinol oxidase subunit 3
MVMQAIEYHEASFTLADRIYGRTFFLLTGFHGLHVIVGGIILRVSLLRILKMKIRRDHHLGILFSI